MTDQGQEDNSGKSKGSYANVKKITNLFCVGQRAV